MSNEESGHSAAIKAAWIGVLGTLLAAVIGVSCQRQSSSGTTGAGEVAPGAAGISSSVDASGGAPTTPSRAASIARVTHFTLELPDNYLDYASVNLDTGVVGQVGMDDLFYQKDEADQTTPTLNGNSLSHALSADVPSGDVTREQCQSAVASSPTRKPIRTITAGLRLCVGTGAGGIALVTIDNSPSSDGKLNITEKYWSPNS
jgi:hypothetical protein